MIRMENMLHMNKYMKNYIISFLSLFFIATITSALEYDEMLQVYRESKFNILSNKISLLEIEAFEGSPESAYKLGRYYQYCLASPKDKKIVSIAMASIPIVEKIANFSQNFRPEINYKPNVPKIFLNDSVIVNVYCIK